MSLDQDIGGRLQLRGNGSLRLDIRLDTLKHQPEFVEEAHPQTDSPVFIPNGGSLYIEVGLTLDDKSPCHPSDQRSRNLRSISVRTSVQSRPAAGFT